MDLATISGHDALYREHLRLGSFAPNTIRIALSDIKYFIKWLNAHYSSLAVTHNHMDVLLTKFSEHLASSDSHLSNLQRRTTSVQNYLSWLEVALHLNGQKKHSDSPLTLSEQDMSDKDSVRISLTQQQYHKKYLFLFISIIILLFIILSSYFLLKQSSASPQMKRINHSDYFVINFSPHFVKAAFSTTSSHVIVLKQAFDRSFSDIRSICTYKFSLENLLYSTLSIPLSSCSPKIDNFSGFIRAEIDNLAIQDFEVEAFGAAPIRSESLDYSSAKNVYTFNDSKTGDVLLNLSNFDDILSDLIPESYLPAQF